MSMVNALRVRQVQEMLELCLIGMFVLATEKYDLLGWEMTNMLKKDETGVVYTRTRSSSARVI